MRFVAQHWNHSFFWTCMKPGGGGAPPAAVEEALRSSFGSVDAFKSQFKEAAVSQFGSGWAWLVRGDDGALKIVKTPNAVSPICFGQAPLLTCDVWEHAYCASRRLLRQAQLTRGRPQTWTTRTSAATSCRCSWTTWWLGTSWRRTCKASPSYEHVTPAGGAARGRRNRLQRTAIMLHAGTAPCAARSPGGIRRR